MLFNSVNKQKASIKQAKLRITLFSSISKQMPNKKNQRQEYIILLKIEIGTLNEYVFFHLQSVTKYFTVHSVYAKKK